MLASVTLTRIRRAGGEHDRWLALPSHERAWTFCATSSPDVSCCAREAIAVLQSEAVDLVLMTAHAMTGDRDRCHAAGMNGYISKPIRPQDLLSLIENTKATSSRT